MNKSKTIPAAAGTSFFRHHMLGFLSSLNLRKTLTKQVSFLSIKSNYLNTSSHVDSSLSLPSNARETNNTHIDSLCMNPIGIAKIIISRYPQYFDRSESESENFVNYSSLKELLLDISDVIPHVTRRFWRISRLKPEDVLEIVQVFQFECEKVAIKSKKVESLWGIFKWASDQDMGFKHLSKSCEVMSSVLIRYGMLREVQLLLLAMERKGVSLDNNEILSKLIEGYVRASDLERAVLVYNRMREQGLVPSLSCYDVLIHLLVRMRRPQLALQICLDMFDIGTNLSNKEMSRVDEVARLLSGDGMVHEARYLMKKASALGFEPSSLVINEIASGYCEKQDFQDLLSFLVAMKCAPNLQVANKILCALCCNFGVERANWFRLELEKLGFRPDEVTFGILISGCCSERNLKSALIFLSDMLSRGLSPSIYSYNALIGSMFREGMWKHAHAILDEMVERGMTPNLSTFRTLLAGYCKTRKFDEVKIMVNKMVNYGLIESSSLENPLSKAFAVLGLNPLSVRLKRDNNVGFSDTEFFDNLGNGLYLDTDLDEYEKRVTAVLKDSLRPDFNLLLREECDHRNFKAVFSLIDEMSRWGEELSLPVFSALIKGLCTSRSHIRACSRLIDKMPKLANELDFEVLNLLVQAYCKSGVTYKGRTIFHQMVQRDITIENGTFSSLIMGLCKLGNLQDFHYCWDIARNRKWLPRLQEYKSLVECLLHHKMLKEALELLEYTLVSSPHLRSEICHVFLEKLSSAGFTNIALYLAQQGCADETAYSHFIRGLCKERNYMAAFTILDTMLAKNMFPCLDVSLILIPHLCRADRLDTVTSLKEIYLKEQSIISSSFQLALVRGYCAMGKVGEAANVVQDMLLEGLLPDAEICNALFQGYCQVNNLKKVNEIFGVLMRKFSGPSISSYQNLMRLMCMQGSFCHALSLKELMLGHCGLHSLPIYNILLFYLLSAGNSLLVDKILNELQEKGLPIDKVTYDFLVYGLSKCKDASGCLHYLFTMISKGFIPSYRSLQTAVTCLCDFGEFGKVLELSREMERRGWIHGSVVQNAIVEGLLSRGKIQEAEYFLDQMVEKGLIPDTINYDNLVKQFCFFGRMKTAVELMNVMLKKGNVPNSASYDSVINGFCARNQLNEAMDFHAEMLEKDLKPSLKTWDMLVHKLCELGKTTEAEKILICMVEFGEPPSRLMYTSVINRYQRENNPSKASQLMQMMQKSGYEPDFESHWSVISHLQSSKDKNNKNSSQGFLSRLLSGSGLSYKKDSKGNV